MDRTDNLDQTRTIKTSTGQISAVQNKAGMNSSVQNIAEEIRAEQREQNRLEQ